MQTKKFSLQFGVLCDPLQKQLADQGIVISDQLIKAFQRDSDDIGRLRVRGYLPDSEIDKISRRLMNKLSTAIQKEYKRQDQEEKANNG